jgi:hypothetical protein
MSIISMGAVIRERAREIGHTARMSSSYITNPYLPGSIFYDHWSDGYDLGVMDANDDLNSNNRESYLDADFSN